MLEVFGQFAEFEILGNAVERPGLGVGLEGAEQQLAGVFLVVGAIVGIAQHRQIGAQPRERLGDDVEMLAGLQRRADAAALRQRARPHAGREHDCVGRDLALVASTTPRARLPSDWIDVDRTFSKTRAPRIVAPLIERHRGIDRIGLAVVGQEDAADDVVDVEQRPLRLDFGWRRLVDLEPEGLGHRGAALQLLEPLGVGGDREAAALQEAGRLTGLGFEAGIEVRRCIARAWSDWRSRAVGRRGRRRARSCRRSGACAPAARRRACRAWSDDRRSRRRRRRRRR